MKKLIIALLALTILSCTNDENTVYPTQQTPHWETITCDTEDNVIKINNVWFHNSNLDCINCQYLQTRGFKLNENELVIVTTNSDIIVEGNLPEVQESLYQITRPNANTIIFHSENPDLMNAGDMYKVILKIVE